MPSVCLYVCIYAISCVKEMRKDESSTANAAGKALSIYVPDYWRRGYNQLNGNVSNHSVVRYAPHGDPLEDFVYDKPSSREKLVWIGLVRNNLIGAYFFDGNGNGQAYLEMLNNFVLPQVESIVGANQQIHTQSLLVPGWSPKTSFECVP